MPDLSKLSNEDLLALKTGDYSKLSNEGLLELKGQYGTPASPNNGGVGAMIKDQLKQGLGPIGLAGQAQEVIQGGFDKAGEKIATSLAEQGIQMAPGTGAKPLPVKPEAAAALGAVMQTTPDIIGSVLPGGAAMNSTAAKVLSKGGLAKTGKLLGQIDKEAGVVQQIPTVSSLAKRLNLEPRERSFADIVNHISKKIESGEKVSPQDLVDFRALVQEKMGTGKIAKGSRIEAIVSDTNKKAGDLLNKSIKGRQPVSDEYAKIKKIQTQLKKLAKYSAGAAGVGAAGYLTKKLIGG